MITPPPTPLAAAGGGVFDRACVEMVQLLTIQAMRELDPEEEQRLADALGSVTTTLPKLLRSNVDGSDYDPQDVAQEALFRFVKAIAQRRVDPNKSPSGYILTIAVNVVRDRQRRAPLPMPVDDWVLDANFRGVDDVEFVSRIADEMASSATIRAGIARARELGDFQAIEVIEVWLNLAAREAKAPTVREVASSINLGKTTVAAALQRLARYLRD